MSRVNNYFYIFIVLLMTSCSWFKKNEETKKSDEISYYMGLQLGQSMKKQDIAIDLKKVLAGVEDGYEGGKGVPSEKEVNQKMMDYVLKKHSQKTGEMVQREDEAKRYLAQNRTRKEVTWVNNDLQFEILKKGKGPLPKIEDKVELKMQMQLLSGEVVSKEENFKTLNMIELLAGVRDALRQTPGGSTVRVFMTNLMAYGARGTDKVPPASGLIVDVELRKVLPANTGEKPHL